MNWFFRGEGFRGQTSLNGRALVVSWLPCKVHPRNSSPPMRESSPILWLLFHPPSDQCSATTFGSCGSLQLFQSIQPPWHPGRGRGGHRCLIPRKERKPREYRQNSIFLTNTRGVSELRLGWGTLRARAIRNLGCTDPCTWRDITSKPIFFPTEF